MPNAETFRALERGGWAEPAPGSCLCGGGGWFLSGYDTWHKCPIHYYGTPDPESEGEMHAAVGSEEDGFGPDEQAKYQARQERARLDMLRKLYRQLRQDAYGLGFRGSFKAACAEIMATPRFKEGRTERTLADPARWVDAACEIRDCLSRKYAEKEARRNGYSCALESRLADEAARERGDREHGGRW